MMIFVTVGMCVNMSVSQLVNEGIAVGSFRYWLVVLMALLLPLPDLPQIAVTLLGRAKLLLFFLMIAGAWYLIMGDVRAVIQLLLLVYVLTWVSTDGAKLDVQDLTRLYFFIFLVGLGVIFFTNENLYGIIPGRSAVIWEPMRVSIFPNIAFSGILSLAMILILTKTPGLVRAHPIIFAMAVYFLVFSLVRTTLIAVVIYLIMRWWFSTYRVPAPKQMFWTAVIVAFGFNIVIALSAGLLYLLQHNVVISGLFLRGETDISIERIAYQLYRPWLWAVQFKLFATSPWWMGWGVFDFSEFTIGDAPPLISGGTESLPTRLLTVYGIPAVLFTLYLLVRLRKLALEDDRWACACFPALFILMTNWGSAFHPTDALFVLLMLIMMRGSQGFDERYSLARLTQSQQARFLRNSRKLVTE